MGRVTVSKEVTIDCAHMLSGHQALCKNLHGHTYKIVITVHGETIKSGSSMDMIIDFKHLKQAITEVIVNKFDHAVIFSAKEYRGSAEEALYNWAYEYGLRYFVMPARTTAENMAKYFSSAICDYLVKSLCLENITKVSARVYETPTSYAEV